LSTTDAPADRTGAALRGAAGAALAANPRVHLSEPARSALLPGLVDVRLTGVLADLAATTPLSVGSFARTPGDRPGTPLREVVVSPIQPGQLPRLRDAVRAQAGDYLTDLVAEGNDGLLIRVDTPGLP